MRNEKGQSIVEMALLFPLLMLLLMGLLDLGRAYYVIVALRDAAEEGAIYASIQPEDITGIQERAADVTGELVPVEPGDVSVNAPSLDPGQAITVTVLHDYAFYMPLVEPFLPEEGITLHGTATHAIISQ